MPQLNKVTIPMAHEDTDYGSFSLTNGHGQLTKTGVSVQQGAKVTAKVDLQMTIVTNENTQTWMQNNKNLFTAAQASQIQQHLDQCDTASGWNAIFASSFTTSKNMNYFENANNTQVQATNQTQKNTLDSIKNLQSQKVNVTGKLKIKGVSMIPTQAFIFAEITTITFSDGNQMHVINQSNPVVASSSGDTSGAEVEPGQQLNIVPVS